MAGGIFSLAKLFGITLRESADDGSDFTNPDADYRRLFLGEDGDLHLKDSAGTVTDIGGAAGAPNCYETFLAAGDVTMVNADTWYSTTELALTPPSGDYLVMGHLSMVSAHASATPLRAKLSTGGSLASNVLTGDTAVAEGLTYNPASNGGGMVSLTIMARVTVGGSTEIRLSGSDVRGSSDGKISETLLSLGTANKASSLVATKITSV